MKILELRFKNLNSLYGEWLIDFTDPEYTCNGIFALVGPTGSGKSTILDALCLALYGATPRLGRITKSSNEIMSCHTGECYAEVLFESQIGRFRCHWEQRRARKQLAGNLQDQEHQIIDADTGKPIETKKSLVSKVIEEKTGMDFDRFTRSILLAQGGFDTFLKADVEQKSKILEQITGTEIYSEISKRVHEWQRAEQEKLNLLKAEISGIIPLEPHQETVITQQLQTQQQTETSNTNQLKKTNQALIWLTNINTLQQELTHLDEQNLTLQADLENFKPQRTRLEQALKAASLDAPYATLSTLRNQQKTDKATLTSQQNTLPKRQLASEQQAKSLHLAEQQTAQAKQHHQTNIPLIQQIRLLDQTLIQQNQAIQQANSQHQTHLETIHANQQAKIQQQQKHTQAQQQRQHIEHYLTTHAQDEWLVSGLTGIEQQLANLQTQQQQLNQTTNKQQQATTALTQTTEQLSKNTQQTHNHQQTLQNLTDTLKQKQQTLNQLLSGRLLREYRTEKETLLRELALHTKIQQLEEHRKQLTNGNPCPLCGATEHPFAEGNIPSPDHAEKKIHHLDQLINQAETQESAIKTLETQKNTAHNKLTESTAQQENALQNKQTAETALTELTNNLSQAQDELTQLQQQISNKLQPLNIALNDSVPSLIQSLKKRLNDWQSTTHQKTQIEQQITQIKSELKRLDGIIETQNHTSQQQQQQLKILQKQHTEEYNQRKKLYGNKNPDNEENHLNQTIKKAETQEKEISTKHQELQQQLHTAKSEIESLTQRIELREKELHELQTQFTENFQKIGFTDETHFFAAKLTEPQRNTLATQAKQLDDNLKELRTKKTDRNQRLNAEITKKLTKQSLAELEQQQQQIEATLQQQREEIATLKHQLNENTTAKQRIQEKQKIIQAQQKECHRWQKLHHLIGSADGKKYRNFAQGLTFELMIAHANHQLQKMTDRYLLIRDKEHPLELNVIDNYQAGENRSTKNLSGGESFIVSLTLALGLSKMASRKVRVDSLFLDEGFGTLDEDALETALETLSSLQQDGKLIGIISHISALKERIHTQITITPITQGNSTIKGPGCKQLKKT